MDQDYRTLTTEIVAAYVGSNSLPKADLPDLIATVYSALAGLGANTAETQAIPPTPPVPIKKTITPDYLISLEDGLRYKSLKRHLAGKGLTPEQYREKWGLKSDYPMVAPNYSAQRSEMARSLGLGRKRVDPEPTPAAAPKRKPRAKKPAAASADS